MLTLNHILVDLDPSRDSQPALNKAIESFSSVGCTECLEVLFLDSTMYRR